MRIIFKVVCADVDKDEIIKSFKVWFYGHRIGFQLDEIKCEPAEEEKVYDE